MASCESNNAVYKCINPKKYLNECLSRGFRPQNDRSFLECRSCVVKVNVVNKCLSSSFVRIGNTTIMCSIRGEFRKPNRKSQDTGYVQINTKIPNMSCPDSNQKNLGQSIKLCNSFLNNLFLGMGIIDPKNLCICKGELVWVLNIDVICLNYDGSLLDAAVVAVYVALKTVMLPKLDYSLEKDTFTINESVKEPLCIKDCPMSTTFGVFEGIILADPSLQEETYCKTLITILIQDDIIKTIQKQGGYQISIEQMNECTGMAKKRYTILKDSLSVVLKSHEKEIEKKLGEMMIE